MSTLWESRLRKADRYINSPILSSERAEEMIRDIYASKYGVEPELPPLLYASYLGLGNITKAFISCAKQTNRNLQTGEFGDELQKFLWHCNSYGHTALDMAITNNHVEVAKVLLENSSLECLISARNYLGQLPVSLLSDPEHDEFIFKILEDAKSREVHPPTSKVTPTHDYQQRGSSDYIEMTINPDSYAMLSNEEHIRWQMHRLYSRQLQLTPNKNTVLHLVSEWGDVKSFKEILENHSSLLHRRNSEGETAAYVAAREGQVDILALMINHFKEEKAIIEPLLTRDRDQHTALHIAIQNHHVGVVHWLIKEIPQLINCVNDFSVIPHFLAAERGFHHILERVFSECKQQDFPRPDGKTTLHAAAIFGSAACIRTVTKYSKDLVYSQDKRGSTPLFYAIYHNNSSATAALLDADRSIGYQMLKKDDIATSPIQFAASQGHCEIMKVLISRCPGCLEITYGNGRNILHFAIENKKLEVIEFVFSCELFTCLINKRDGDGNTPIHLFMASDLEMMEVIMDSRVDIHVLNNDNRTPLDVAFSDEKRDRLLKGIGNVRSRDDQARVLFPKLNICIFLDELRQKEKEKEKEKEEQINLKSKEKLEVEENEKDFESYLKIGKNLVLVATLIATATFAAAFAVPGGFDGNEGSNEGMPVLIRKSAYRAFVVTNTIAFSCSCSVLIGYVWTLTYRLLYDKYSGSTLKVKIEKRMATMYILTGVALITMVIAFVTGTYVVITPSHGLATFMCVMSVFIVFMSVFPRKVLQLLEYIGYLMGCYAIVVTTNQDNNML